MTPKMCPVLSKCVRYALNQTPYDYTVEVRNRFKGLDLIDRVPDALWNEVRDIVQVQYISFKMALDIVNQRAVWGRERSSVGGQV